MAIITDMVMDMATGMDMATDTTTTGSASKKNNHFSENYFPDFTMQITPTNLNGAVVIQPKVFTDTRGYFFESSSKNVFLKNNITDEFIQDNESLSQKGVLRGLHFQNPPHAQAKLVRVIQGSVDRKSTRLNSSHANISY